jgi:membrane-bound lytic murein transglycosylase F
MQGKLIHIARVAGSIIVVVALLMTSLLPLLRHQKPGMGDQVLTYSQSLTHMDNGAGVEWNQFLKVKECAEEYHVDWQLIIAMIKQESQFDADAVSWRGARGLMQLMPVTNTEVSNELNLSVSHPPGENIRAGVYYFSKLFDLFKTASSEDRYCLALAAYNAGPGRIYDAQELAAYFNENPNSWSTIQHLLPLLSKRYYSLHQHIWKDGKPHNGYFGSGSQTIAYVGEVMNTFHFSKNVGF